MNFSIAEIIRRLWSPNHKLSCSWFLWQRLIGQLRRRGKNIRESGAFLLGTHKNGRSRIIDFILYDDLDPHSLDTGIIRFDGRYYGSLWEHCKQRSLDVIADVHTHPGGSEQSPSDRAHPMIAKTGHIALILPRFAGTPWCRADIGIYRYFGAKNWEIIPADRRCAFLHIGI
jgi:proteasome lid subunit RPN8/RPN11